MASSTTAKRDSMDATASSLEAKMKAASLSQQESTPAPKRPLGLTDLPASVRNNIYRHCLDTEAVNLGEPNVSYTHKIHDGILTFSASRKPFPVATSLFYVSKAVGREALAYFYEKNLWVRLDVYTADARHAKTLLEDSGLLFSTATPAAVEKSTQHALEVVLVEKNSAQKRAAVMFPAQYLPRLINFLDQASRATATWAPMHTLFLTLVNTYSFPISRLQGDLLELFRVLSNLGGVTIDTRHLLPRYAEGLQRMMTEPRFSADSYLAVASELGDLADEAREKEQYALSNEYANAVIIALTYGYLTHAETLHSQDGDAFARAIQRLRWRTELGLGISLSIPLRSLTANKQWMRGAAPPTKEIREAARDLLLAEASVSKALSLVTDSPSPTSNPWFHSLPVELIPSNKPTFFSEREKAQTWYALGTVHMALGENIFACGDFERALELWGKESGVDEEGGLRGKIEEAFERARQGIDGDAEKMWVGDVRPGTGLKKAARLARGL
ncbi:hypothetical protein ACJQWK_11194 [Exserohilum turcicum]|uniref:F-box domain-containing protein n=1 Tax=Exserohilum turcicum (strain 28A) TaxID=671987 RepID=R0KSK2_EXST2|nr:uncharacterized protein SETTUDRAFT_166673 [Exserohilum turcica Et28A]EOA90772.1 hypothetical protein SETTUDRAFT_166673 [Exserohilum turcica Et28A]